MRELSRASTEWTSFPKIELHRHLEGSIRFSTQIELARHLGLLSEGDESSARRKILVTSPMRDLAETLSKFTFVQNLFADVSILRRMTREIVEDAAADGVRVLELRYSPTFIQNGKNVSFDSIHRAIVDGLEDAKSFPVKVGLICIIQRTMGLAEAEKVTDFAVANRGRRRGEFVGLDAADNESPQANRPFVQCFNRARAAGLGLTAHAGEASFPEAVENVRFAVEQLGVSRIGHGVQIIHDETVMQLVKDAGVTLELCPTSNWLTQAIPEFESHPIKHFLKVGIKCTINSDDPVLFGITLSHEYEHLERRLGLSKDELDRCHQYARDATFLKAGL